MLKGLRKFFSGDVPFARRLGSILSLISGYRAPAFRAWKPDQAWPVVPAPDPTRDPQPAASGQTTTARAHSGADAEPLVELGLIGRS